MVCLFNCWLVVSVGRVLEIRWGGGRWMVDDSEGVILW